MGSLKSKRGTTHQSHSSSSESEGSAGVAAIPLAEAPGSPGPSKSATSRRRAIGRAVIDFPSSSSEVSDVHVAGRTRRRTTTSKAVEAKRRNPPRSQPQPANASASKSRRRPHPLDLSQISRPTSFYVELPKLTPAQKSAYSLFPKTTQQSIKPPAELGSKEKRRQVEHLVESRPATARKYKKRENGSASGSEQRSPSLTKQSSAEQQRVEGRKRSHMSSESDMPRRPATRRVHTAQKAKIRRRIRDPDESGDAETEDEDYVKELEMDEPERFKSQTRLRRKKETAVQRNIRKLKERRDGIVHSTTESESEEDTWGYETVSDSEEGFIVDDGGRVEEGLLPHQFSNNSAQTPEFKFKVVFHYLVLLVIKGPSLLPLKGELAEYFKPQLRDLRRKMEGHRDGRVRSQIWQPQLVRALQTFPAFRTIHLDLAELGCDACNVGAKRSTFRVYLEGGRYDKETHEAEESEASGSDSSSEVEMAREFLMGKYCKRRAEVYHHMSHWENQLFQRIRGYYNDLLRAKGKPVPEDSEASSSDSSEDSDADERKADRALRRQTTADRVARLRRGRLPGDVYNENQVLEWMDMKGYQAADYRRLEDLMEQSRMLEHDKKKDD